MHMHMSVHMHMHKCGSSFCLQATCCTLKVISMDENHDGKVSNRGAISSEGLVHSLEKVPAKRLVLPRHEIGQRHDVVRYTTSDLVNFEVMRYYLATVIMIAFALASLDFTAGLLPT